MEEVRDSEHGGSRRKREIEIEKETPAGEVQCQQTILNCVLGVVGGPAIFHVNVWHSVLSLPYTLRKFLTNLVSPRGTFGGDYRKRSVFFPRGILVSLRISRIPRRDTAYPEGIRWKTVSNGMYFVIWIPAAMSILVALGRTQHSTSRPLPGVTRRVLCSPRVVEFISTRAYYECFKQDKEVLSANEMTSAGTFRKLVAQAIGRKYTARLNKRSSQSHRWSDARNACDPQHQSFEPCLKLRSVTCGRRGEEFFKSNKKC